MRAHIVNGLLPAARVARQLRAWDAPRMRRFDEKTYRLFCAGFTLHDWVKFPEVDSWLASAGLDHASANPARALPLIEGIFRHWSARLGLDRFLAPIGGVDAWLHDLIYLACNTQVRWGTMLNLAELPGAALDGRSRQLATDLCTLADRVAYIARTPRDVPATRGITEVIAGLSDGQAHLLYHHVAENRGVLTNFLHNAAMAALTTPDCMPLLYAPSGVVYLARGRAAALEPADVAEQVIRRIRQVCGAHLKANLTGFSRDGKGLKYAPYYDLHFSPGERVRLAARAAFRRIPESKPSSAGKRFGKIAELGMAPAGVDLALPDDIRVDQLAEFCAVAAKIAGQAAAPQESHSDRVARGRGHKVARQPSAPQLDPDGMILARLGLQAILPDFGTIAAYPRAGGVAYHWYYAAGYYLKSGAGKGASPSEWQALVEELAEAIAGALEQTAARQGKGTDGWDDLRNYVSQVLSFGPEEGAEASQEVPRAAATELARYAMSKAQGRGRDRGLFRLFLVL